MKVYTKTGDGGMTSLFGGKRVSKADLRIDSYGTIDELNSYTALLRDQKVNKKRSQVFLEIQDRLFTMGSILATEPGNTKVKIPALKEGDIRFLEKKLMRWMPNSLPCVFLCCPADIFLFQQDTSREPFAEGRNDWLLR
jgi:cob(I)alamin adenosyltransferase